MEVFLKEANKFSREVKKFRYQMIIAVSGVLTVFVAIHGGDDISKLIKFGFLFLGCSLISGIVAILLSLSNSIFKMSADWLNFAREGLKQDIKKLELLERKYEKIKNFSEIGEDQGLKMLAQEIGSNLCVTRANANYIIENLASLSKNEKIGLEFIEKINKKGNLVNYEIVATIFQIALFISGIILITISIIC